MMFIKFQKNTYISRTFLICSNLLFFSSISSDSGAPLWIWSNSSRAMSKISYDNENNIFLKTLLWIYFKLLSQHHICFLQAVGGRGHPYMTSHMYIMGSNLHSSLPSHLNFFLTPPLQYHF